MLTFTALSALAFAAGAFAGFYPTNVNNVATYWGQNSAGGQTTQSNLSEYCSDPNIDIIPMAFLHGLKTPLLNLGNVGDTCSTLPSGLLHCPNVGADITSCQEQGKTIILSIGGATYSEGGFESEEEAIATAEWVWVTFGPNYGDGTAERPFDDASVDGFDLDFESTIANMATFANRLRELMDPIGDYILTAAPQCPFPDAANGEMLDGAVYFDFVWVQFYNNFCGVNHFGGGSNPGEYNFEAWDNWARTASKNPDVKVMIGVPGSPSAAGSGYVDASVLTEIIAYTKQFDSFGGVMVWDVSQAYTNNPGFLGAIKSALGGTYEWVMRRGLRFDA